MLDCAQMRTKITLAAGVFAVAASLLLGQQPVTLTVNVDRPGVKIDPIFYGLMNEEINFSYDGGLYAELIRNRAHAYAPLSLAWFEEPLPAEDLGGHVELARFATMPIAVGESLYHPAHFREYLERGACSIVQVDCARIGGITPWLKVAHLAETFNVAVCPHFLMELHVSLTAAVPNGAWVEYIPQLDAITTSRMAMQDGYALPPSAPGLGIDWDMAAIERAAVARAVVR